MDEKPGAVLGRRRSHQEAAWPIRRSGRRIRGCLTVCDLTDF
jgi:hypothetical protein